MARVVEVLDAERALDRVERGLRRRHRLVLLVVEVVRAGELGLVLALGRLARRGLAAEVLDDPGEVVVRARRGLGLTGDDQRRARLVDQDRVDLVHDRERVAALDDVVERDRHVVAEVVEAELGVRAVRDVGLVGGLAEVERHHVLDEADRHPEALEDAAVPFGVALGEVVVHRHEVDSGAREARSGRGPSRRRTSCPHRSSSRRCRPRAGRCRPSSERRTSAAATRASAPPGRRRTPRRAARRATRRSPAARGTRPSSRAAPRRRAPGIRLERRDVRGLLLEPLQAPPLAEAKDLLEFAEIRGRTSEESVPGGRRALIDSSHNRLACVPCEAGG